MSACAIKVVLKLTISASVTTGLESWSISRPGGTWTKIASDRQGQERQRRGRGEEVAEGEQSFAHGLLARAL